MHLDAKIPDALRYKKLYHFFFFYIIFFSCFAVKRFFFCLQNKMQMKLIFQVSHFSFFYAEAENLCTWKWGFSFRIYMEKKVLYFLWVMNSFIFTWNIKEMGFKDFLYFLIDWKLKCCCWCSFVEFQTK